jgi:hypothetical protein
VEQQIVDADGRDGRVADDRPDRQGHPVAAAIDIEPSGVDRLDDIRRGPTTGLRPGRRLRTVG